MPQISVPSIKWGKRKNRSQMCEIFTDDGRILTVELAVLFGCVDDPERKMGFLLDDENQFVSEDGHWTQILGERSSIPMCLVKPENADVLKNRIGTMGREVRENAKQQLYDDAKKNLFADKILNIVVVGVVALLIFGAMKFLRGGG